MLASMHALMLMHAAFFIIITATQQQIPELDSELSLLCMHHVLLSTSVRLINAAGLLSTGASYLSRASNHVDQLDQMSQCLAVGLPCGRPWTGRKPTSQAPASQHE